MLGRIFPKASYRTAAPFMLAALLLVATLLISFLSGYQIYRRFYEAKNDEVQKSLKFIEYVAETYQSSIENAAKFYMTAIYDSYNKLPQTEQAWKESVKGLQEIQGEVDQLPGIIERISKITGATSVALFYPQKYTLLEHSSLSNPPLVPGSLPVFRENDEASFQAVVTSGTLTTTKPKTLKEPQVVHQFSPIYYSIVKKEGPNEVTETRLGAVLRIEVPFDGFKQTNEIRKLGLSLAAVVTGLTAIVALLFYRLMGSFIRISETAAHADRLQAMGTLSAGIAHELRNPLGIIRALAEGLRSDFEEDDPRREMVDDITEEVERLGRLVADYLQFARPDVRQPDDQARPIEIIENLMLLIRKGDKASVPLELRAAQNPPNVDMNSTAFRQVMMNLIMNAIEASDSNQPIVIEFQARRNNSQVRITVTDQGCGISERELRHIFDPFYTSKAQGTGLGLAICYQLVTECRGKINIESAEGKGTTVELILPAVPTKPRVEANN